MSEKQEPTTSPAPISSAEDSPVKTSASPEQEQASKGNEADSGPSLPASLASYDPDSLCWRTSQRSVLGGWVPFSDQDWPRSGMMLSGTAYPLQPSAPRTGGTAGSASHGPHTHQYPTPAATEYGSSGNGTGNNVLSRGRPSLGTMARHRMWPTPTAAVDSGSRNTANSKAHAGISLTDAVRGDGGKGRTWHTPTASDWKNMDTAKQRSVARQVKTWPTPCATDWKSGYSTEGLALQLEKRAKPLRDMAATGGRLSPAWVEALMGFPPGFTEVE